MISANNYAADQFAVALRTTPSKTSDEERSEMTPSARREREFEAIEYERWDGMS